MQVNYPTPTVAPRAAASSELLLQLRVGRVLQELAADRALTDQEIRQHARDCSLLMEAAYGRFEATGNPHDREEACLWMHRRDEALRIFSRRGIDFVELGR